MKWAAALVLTSIVLISGILYAQGNKNSEAAAKELAHGMIRVTPIELFPGDLKRLQPHLEMEGACFKIEYNGPKRKFNMVTEIWRKGARKTAGISGVEFERQSTAEASISIKKASDVDGLSAWRVISHSLQGPSAGTTTFPLSIPNGASASGNRSVNAVTEFDANKEIALWCIVRTAGGIEFVDTIDELAKSVDLAVVLKLVPQDGE